jgi:hypothetical protein
MQELKLEWLPAFDGDWICRIVEQPEHIERRCKDIGTFAGVKINSLAYPDWDGTTLFTRGSSCDLDMRAFMVPSADRPRIEAAVAAFNESWRPKRKWSGWLVRWGDGTMSVHVDKSFASSPAAKALPLVRIEIDEAGTVTGGPEA